MWSKQDSDNLEGIRNALEEIAKNLPARFKILNIPNIQEPSNSLEISNEKEFFQRLTMIYFDEEKRKRELQHNKKSAIIVSKKLYLELVSFFSQKLPTFEVTTEHSVIFFNKNNKTEAILKFYTDLGYHKGEKLYDEINRVVKIAKTYDVQKDRVFFIIGSWTNGLKEQHVEDILGKKVKNSDLLNTRELLDNYLKKFVEKIPNLQNPSKQVYFLAAEINPNLMATKMLDYKISDFNDLDNYNWLQPSITELLEYLQNL